MIRLCAASSALLMLAVGCALGGADSEDLTRAPGASSTAPSPSASGSASAAPSGSAAPVPMKPAPTSTSTPTKPPAIIDGGIKVGTDAGKDAGFDASLPDASAPVPDATTGGASPCNGSGGSLSYRTGTPNYMLTLTPACLADGITLTVATSCAPQFNFMTVNGTKSVTFLGQSTVSGNFVADFAINWNGSPAPASTLKIAFNDIGLGACPVLVTLK